MLPNTTLLVFWNRIGKSKNKARTQPTNCGFKIISRSVGYFNRATLFATVVLREVNFHWNCFHKQQHSLPNLVWSVVEKEQNVIVFSQPTQLLCKHFTLQRRPLAFTCLIQMNTGRKYIQEGILERLESIPSSEKCKQCCC